MKTYITFSSTIVLDKNNIVVESNSPSILVGSKISNDQIKRCGWKKVKSAKLIFANGSKTGQRFI